MGWCFVALSLLVFVDGVLADGFGFDEGLFELGVVGGGGIGGGDRPDGVLFFVEGADVPVVGGEGPYFLVGGFGGGRPREIYFFLKFAKIYDVSLANFRPRENFCSRKFVHLK